MNLSKLLYASLLSLLLLVHAPAQETQNAVLVDRTENSFCTEDVRARLDTFLIELQQRPGAIGYVIGTADSSIPGRFSKYFKTIQSQIRFRRFDPSRINLYRAPDGKSMRFDYWISQDGVSKPELPVGYRLSAITEPTLYDSSLITSVSSDGVQFGFERDEPCDWGLHLTDFAMILNSDRNLQAYLIASAESRSKINFARWALSLTVKALTQKHGISTRRIKTKFVGVHERNEMQLWLVPQGSTGPELREGMLR